MRRFFPSLKAYREKYLSLVGLDESNPPAHFAYLCPLCLQSWILTVREGLFMNIDFSPDHYPPKSVAEKFIFSVLTCKSCNSTAGSDYDHSLKGLVQSIAFKRRMPNASIPVLSQISNVVGKYPSLLTVNDQREVEMDLKPFAKFHAPYLDQFMERSKVKLDWKIEMTIRNANEQLVSKALLKTAYLICFEAWGYDFAFSQNGGRIRDVLAGNETYPIANLAQWMDEHMKIDEHVRVPLGLCYIRQPFDCRTFIVNISLMDKDTKCRVLASVPIPNPTEGGWEDLRRVQDIFLRTSELPIFIEHVQGFTLNEGVTNGYNRAWQHIAHLSQ